jgi:PAS domain S-box-containing protein/putative nucleotidyltransferase with HDIG domain
MEDTAVSLEPFQQIFEKSRAVKLVMDPGSLYIVGANSAACDFYGYAPQELKGMKITDINTMPYETVCEYVTRALAGKDNHFICRHRLSSGEARDVEVYSSPCHVGGRKLLYSIVHDISSHRVLEKTLEEVSHRYELILNSVGDGILGIDVNGNTTFVNPTAVAITGFSQQELIGRHQHEILHHTRQDGSAYPHDECPIYSTLRDGKARYVTEEVFWRKDGTSFPVEYMSTPVKERGRITGVVVVFKDISERMVAAEAIKKSFEDMRNTLNETVNALAGTAEKRDPYTAGHQQRVSALACAIAREMGLLEMQIEGIRIAGILHDIGKIAIPAEILTKPGRLTDIEMELMKTHSQVGYDILKNIPFGWRIADIVLQHQERMDGSGYPFGLSGNDILPEARILAVADVVEAMMSHRPYRAALGIEIALKEISGKKGIIYDSKAVDACLRLFKDRDFSF